MNLYIDKRNLTLPSFNGGPNLYSNEHGILFYFIFARDKNICEPRIRRRMYIIISGKKEKNLLILNFGHKKLNSVIEIP
jgi:hypothetical protein